MEKTLVFGQIPSTSTKKKKKKRKKKKQEKRKEKLFPEHAADMGHRGHVLVVDPGSAGLPSCVKRRTHHPDGAGNLD